MHPVNPILFFNDNPALDSAFPGNIHSSLRATSGLHNPARSGTSNSGQQYTTLIEMNAIKFQSVVRDASGNILANKPVTFRINIWVRGQPLVGQMQGLIPITWGIIKLKKSFIKKGQDLGSWPNISL